MSDFHYDVAIVGAGPVGSLCALAHVRRGARVALLEANPKAARRLAGEWLHPPALRMLEALGVRFGERVDRGAGAGFVVFPEDGSSPIALPYPGGSRGWACDHAELVSRLREAVATQPRVSFLPHARVRSIEGDRVIYTRKGKNGAQSVRARRVIGADGRASVVRESLGLSTARTTCSRMVGVMLSGIDLPFEGYGHVFCGGPGPVLAYRLGADQIRLIVDVPLDRWAPRDRTAFLWEGYAGALPEALRPAFGEALRTAQFHGAANEVRPRTAYGRPERVLIGDAVGHYHPMTAVGLTLGFGDALALAECDDFDAFVAERRRATWAPELLAMGLYEIFADHRPESVALRRAVYLGWRGSPGIRARTMRFLAGEDSSALRLGLAFSRAVARALRAECTRAFDARAWRRGGDLVRSLGLRLGWLVRGRLRQRAAQRGGGGAEREERARAALARAFLMSMPDPGDRVDAAAPEPAPAAPALARASARLLSLEKDDGGWEGEMVWCPMLAAQYVMLHHLLGREIEPGRRRRLLRNFERTRLAGDLWGLHEHAAPSLFVTTSVYVASRLLGVERGDPSLAPARRFLRAEDVASIPSWGKLWLALLNLYEWRGVNALLPELWYLPRWLPAHPSNWYCHTRLIYMAMAAVYAHRYRAPLTPLIESLREELFPQGFAAVDFDAARNRLRRGDLYAAPGAPLQAAYALGRLFERLHGKGLRRGALRSIEARIRWELRTTDHTSISPVSGLLNILALWLGDREDPDARCALERLEGWIWEDEERGARMAGARSASWDTAFSLQALDTVREAPGVRAALERGADFLRAQQIGTSFAGFREAHRIDPEGGWCFAGAWHGWPVSDCTAEAVLGLAAARGVGRERQALDKAARFMLRCQNRDGGFGSYEARRAALDLEWLNPAEMFAESMTEHSYVECTASCLAALAVSRDRLPVAVREAAVKAMAHGGAWLRAAQESDGAWRGAWGVQFVYGTWFGIRGLLASGARPGDPAVRAACRWLLARQRADGGWGEHHSGCLEGRYVEHAESQVIHSAWALTALLEASEPDWAALSRGARFLIERQDAAGAWPKQDMAGVFFRTALLDYVLYRQYFPLQALGLYERRRRARLAFAAAAERPLVAAAGG